MRKTKSASANRQVHEAGWVQADEVNGDSAGGSPSGNGSTQSNGGWVEYTPAQRRRYVYRSAETSRISPDGFRCRVTVAADHCEVSGTAQGPEKPGLRAEIAARATVYALNKAENGEVVLTLKDARVVRVGGRPLVVVAASGTNGVNRAWLVGAANVETSVEQAAIQAALQAADRWVAREAARH